MTIKKLYIAGPYSARPNSPDSYHEIQANIMRASAAAAKAIRAGWSPFTPHKNTAGFEALGVPNERFIQMDLVWLEHADAILMIGEWERSEGALREISRARELGIPVLEIDEYGQIPDAGIMR